MPFLNFILGVLVVVVIAIVLFSVIALTNKIKQSKITATNTQTQTTGTTKPKKNFLSKGKIIWAIIGFALVIGVIKFISDYNNRGPGLPRGNLMENAADSAEYRASLKLSDTPKELQAAHNFYFDEEVIKVKLGKPKKIKLSKGISPIIEFPVCSHWGLIMEDSVWVWPEPGYSKPYLSTPINENKIRWYKCRLFPVDSNSTVTAWAHN